MPKDKELGGNVSSEDVDEGGGDEVAAVEAVGERLAAQPPAKKPAKEEALSEQGDDMDDGLPAAPAKKGKDAAEETQFDDDLIDRAQDAGLSEEDLKEFDSPKKLERHLDLLDRHVARLAIPRQDAAGEQKAAPEKKKEDLEDLELRIARAKHEVQKAEDLGKWVWR